MKHKTERVCHYIDDGIQPRLGRRIPVEKGVLRLESILISSHFFYWFLFSFRSYFTIRSPFFIRI